MGKSVNRILVVLWMLIAAGCGGEDGFLGSTTTGVSASASNMTLLTSSPQLGSAGSVSVTITAIIKDSSNQLMEDVPVTFSADSGSLTVTQATTDASGQAIATLSPGGDYTNRTITVTAIAGSLTQTVNVSVTGTSLAISGEASATIGDTATLTIVLSDSDGDSIPSKTVTVSSALGNTLSASTLTTDSTGQVQVTVTAGNSGTDTITVSAQGATATHSLTISGDQFQLTAPTANQDINLTTCEPVTVSWSQNGTPQAAQTVNFSVTRGNLYSDNGCTVTATSAVTNGSGIATMYVTSNNAGPSTITAYVTSGPTTSRLVNFVATTPATLELQADPSTIGPNDGSQTDQQQATIIAIVRDASNNLVKNKVIRFSITQDNSGGTLTTATATTDALGRASTTYISSAGSTAKDGVIIRAEVEENTAVNNTVSLTVAQSSLFVRLGTGNNIEAVGQTQYDKKYTVLVTDASGNAVPNAEVNISINPVGFTKGTYTLSGSWSLDFTAPPLDQTTFCNSEDTNENGILDAGEDVNGDGILTPGNIATTPTEVTTGADGTAEFSVLYPREYANWVKVRLTASDSVSGTEASHSVRFWLPVEGSALSDPTVAPPGTPSPFGSTSGLCTDTL